MSWYLTETSDLSLTTQVVVVGAGASGAFVALTLAEAGLDVVVLEDGDHHPNRSFGVSWGAALPKLFVDSGMRMMDGSPPMPIPGGKGLGGSTLVNSAIAFSTPAQRLAEWNELTGGAFADERGFYSEQAAIERLLGVSPTPDALLSGNDRAHRRAARRLGWSEGNLPRNTPHCGGCGRCNLGCPTGGKASVDQTILPRAAAAGAAIYTRCRVTSVAPGEVHGFVRDGSGAPRGDLRVSADAVVLCAGSIGTPRLLLDAGLAEEGGPVGAGLRVLPVSAAHGILPEPAYGLGATQGHFIDEWDHDACLLEANPVIAGGVFQVLSAQGPTMQELLTRATHFVSSGAMVRDTSQGRVHRSTSPGASVSYSVNLEDRDRLIRGIRRCAELWFDGADAELVVPSVYGFPICRSMDEVLAATPLDLPPSRLLLYASHPQSSCAVGRALDRHGELPAAPGVFVFDAAALPSNVGRNPQISVMTLARVLSMRLAETLGETPISLENEPPPATGARGP